MLLMRRIVNMDNNSDSNNSSKQPQQQLQLATAATSHRATWISHLVNSFARTCWNKCLRGVTAANGQRATNVALAIAISQQLSSVAIATWPRHRSIGQCMQFMCGLMGLLLLLLLMWSHQQHVHLHHGQQCCCCCLLLLLFAMLCTLRLSGFFGTMTPAEQRWSLHFTSDSPSCSFMQMRLGCCWCCCCCRCCCCCCVSMQTLLTCMRMLLAQTLRWTAKLSSSVVVVVLSFAAAAATQTPTATPTSAAATAWLVGLCDHSWVSCARTVKQTLRAKEWYCGQRHNPA